MIHRGRHRYRSHAGIPYGSTNKLGSKLALYLQHNLDIEAGQWDDQSPNNRHATQSTSGDQAAVSGGGLDFESGEGDHYDLASEVTISSEEGFIVFIVCDIESIATNMTILSKNDATHFLQFVAGADDISIKLASTNTTASPSTTNLFHTTSGKFLLTVEREAGGTGNINLYKNGVLLAQGSQAANIGDAEFVALGVRNADRYFDGIIYDVAFIEAGAGTAAIRDRINVYLTSKHAIHE